MERLLLASDSSTNPRCKFPALIRCSDLGGSIRNMIVELSPAGLMKRHASLLSENTCVYVMWLLSSVFVYLTQNFSVYSPQNMHPTVEYIIV